MDLTFPSIASRLFTNPPITSIPDPASSDRPSTHMPFKPSITSTGQQPSTVSNANPSSTPLIVNVQEANSPPRHLDNRKDKIQARPVTPMDFFTSTHDRDNRKNPIAEDRGSRNSIDQRPPVDPAIKGVPQGWEDDPTMPVLKTTIKSGEIPTSVPTKTNTLQKFGPFKDTRSKLSSFSGTMRSGLRDRDKEEKRPAGLKLHKGSVRSTVRSSSMVSSPSNLEPLRRSNHQPIQSVYSEASFNTQNTEDSIPLVPPSAPTETTECSTADFSHLFTPTSQMEHDYPASITSSHSAHSRERVMGMSNDPSPVPPAGMKTFAHPTIDEVLPFAAGHPFAAWSAPLADEDQQSSGDGSVGRRGSMSLSRLDILSPKHSLLTDSSISVVEGWKETPRPKSSLPGKKVWMDGKGDKLNGVYSVGWERDVLDLEERLHETMYEIAGEKHSSVDFAQPPTAVLDIGTGAGFWPISMALQYPDTTFIGLDLVPCQTDLSILAGAERRARTTKDGSVAEGLGMWESLEKRVKWQRGNFLNELPFDTGVFDLVHIRFVNPGIPESKWYDLLEEATRVLKRGGKIEIVETDYNLPQKCPTSLKNSFASMLLADMIQPVPSLAMQFNLPSVESLKANSVKPVFHQKWKRDVPGALEDAVLGWVKSAVEYKGTGLIKDQNGLEGIVGRVKEELARNSKDRWDFGANVRSGKEDDDESREVNVWAWVATKK